jgi:hypothetical protein
MQESQETYRIRDRLRSARLEDLQRARDRIVTSLPEVSWFNKATETAVFLEGFRRTGMHDPELCSRVFYTVEDVLLLEELAPVVRSKPRSLGSIVCRPSAKVLFLSSKFDNFVSSQEFVSGVLTAIGSDLEVIIASRRSIGESYSARFPSFRFEHPGDLRELCRNVRPDKIVDLSGDHFGLLAAVSRDFHIADPWGLSNCCGLEQSSLAWPNTRKYINFYVNPYTVDIAPIYLPAESAVRKYPVLIPMSAERAKKINLGAFCRTSKLSAKVVSVWVDIMRENPSTTLTFAFIQSNSGSEAFVKSVFEKSGVSSDRVRFLPRLDTASYLSQLNNIDINLGAMPEQGGISCMDSLLMGCPYPVCRELSNTFTSCCVLKELGLNDWVVETIEEYRALLARLISEVRLSRELGVRMALRDRLLDSPLANARSVAKLWSHFLRV